MSAQGAPSPLPPDRRAPTPNAGEDAAGYLTLDADDPNVPQTIEPQADGSLIITIGQPAESLHEEGGFFENLATVIPDPVLGRIADELLRRIEQDKKAREERDKQYEEGIRRTGLGNDAPGGAQFEGASRVVHPMLTEACVDYESRIIKELWPISGPVKPKIVGVITKEKNDRAKRKVEYMNYQLTTLIKEARAVMETTLTQVPLGGVQYILQWQDHRLKRPRWQFIGVDKVYVPFSAEDFYSAHRRTYSETITNVEYLQRVRQKMYRDLDLPKPSAEPEKSKTEAANFKAEGVQETGLNLDADRELYVTMAYLEVTAEMAAALEHEEEDDLNPYLITIDVSSKKILSFYRDWEEQDNTKEPIDHLFEMPFIPWRGAYSIGLPQIIGGLSGAATGSLRALLDSAHIANTQGYFVLKGSGVSGQNKAPNPGEAVEIDGGLETPDITKKVMPFNTKEPSSVLFQLLGFLVEASKGTVRTSLDESAIDTNTNVPVGTQLSRVEEGLVVFSSIHGRIHQAFNRLLLGLHRLNRLYLPDAIRVDTAGKELFVKRSDFEGSPDVQPVSDPTVYSDQQRFAQMQAIQQRMQVVPNLYQARAVEKRFLKLFKIPDEDELLSPEIKPQELNAVNENVAMSLGRPTVAFPEQDHLAHLQVHLDFMQSPVLGHSPLIMQKFLPAALQHCVEHIVMYYAKITNDLVSNAAGTPAVDLMSSDDNVKQALDQLLAMASQQVVPATQAAFQRAMPVLLQAMQTLQQIAPKPPMDPATAAVQAAAAETQRKGQNDQVQGALQKSKLDAQTQNDQQRNAIDFQRVQTMRDNAALQSQTRLAQTQLDNETARDVESARVESGSGGPRFTTGESLKQA